MPNHDRFECQTVIDLDAILQLFPFEHYCLPPLLLREAFLLFIQHGLKFGFSPVLATNFCQTR